jgi:hypothetical protein
VKRDRGDEADDGWREADNLGHDGLHAAAKGARPAPTRGQHQPDADGEAESSPSGPGRGSSRDNSHTAIRCCGNRKRARLILSLRAAV